ncbi:MAG: hypothetical protein FWF60_09705 [Oscillospiraceae bacterium]|nr:hypothetical protein [Oscillospiraceae bacterium]
MTTNPRVRMEGHTIKGILSLAFVVVLVAAFYTNAHAWEDPMYFSDDGMTRLAVPVETFYIQGRSPEIWFYKQDTIVLRHRIFDLLRGGANSLINVGREGKLIYWRWDIPDQRLYDRENNTLQVTTVEGREVVFSLSTGEILSGETFEHSTTVTITTTEQIEFEHGATVAITITGQIEAALICLAAVAVLCMIVKRSRFKRDRSGGKT